VSALAAVRRAAEGFTVARRAAAASAPAPPAARKAVASARSSPSPALAPGLRTAAESAAWFGSEEREEGGA
jgi:hypothetical protein